MSKPLPPPFPIQAQLSMALRVQGAKFVHIQDVGQHSLAWLSESLLGMSTLPLDEFKKAWGSCLDGERAYDNTTSVFRRLNAELNGVMPNLDEVAS